MVALVGLAILLAGPTVALLGGTRCACPFIAHAYDCARASLVVSPTLPGLVVVDRRRGLVGLGLEQEEFDFHVGADVVVGDEREHVAAWEALDGGDELVLQAFWKALRVSWTMVVRCSSIVVFSTSV